MAQVAILKKHLIAGKKDLDRNYLPGIVRQTHCLRQTISTTDKYSLIENYTSKFNKENLKRL